MYQNNCRERAVPCRQGQDTRQFAVHGRNRQVQFLADPVFRLVLFLFPAVDACLHSRNRAVLDIQHKVDGRGGEFAGDKERLKALDFLHISGADLFRRAQGSQLCCQGFHTAGCGQRCFHLRHHCPGVFQFLRMLPEERRNPFIRVRGRFDLPGFLFRKNRSAGSQHHQGQ